MSRIIAVGEDIYKDSLEYLNKAGYTVVTVKASDYLEKQVSSHADMYMTQINGRIFADSRVNYLFTNVNYKSEIVYCDREVAANKKLVYPKNIEFNCVQVGNNLICNKQYTCKKIIDYATDCKMNIINVKQGYSKCSTCVVADNAIITEDESIYKSALENGINALKIEKGFVSLSGYNYGFIGGCSGLLEKNLLAFNGDISRHPDYSLIREFCRQNSAEIVSLCDRELYDIGSILRIQ